jgi:hypothetical protein
MSGGPSVCWKPQGSTRIREIFWDKFFPGQIPPTPVTALTPEGNRFSLEGHELIIVEVGHSDTAETSVLHVPGLHPRHRRRRFIVDWNTDKTFSAQLKEGLVGKNSNRSSGFCSSHDSAQAERMC